ncbi:hypothetical protein [Aureispira anguillae]|uniref:GLPGLI family protein n=1 Tax=Aureispira anguillae TaxID=2864201 RepID=A0A915YAZ8_9BACT|nr:hypothetical protein [Aureispira anguillae]BDS09748.1 hypothetical protein AsAng_0004530 [Aureispira anguillae]
MKFTANVLLVLIICLGSITSSFAQKKKAANFNEGVIKYQIEIEGAPEVSQFVNNSIINLYLKGEDSKMDVSIMGGMANFQIINNIKEDLLTLLMDVPSFYEKTAVSIDENSDIFKQLKKTKNKNQAPEKEVKVEYFKNKKKKIAKYPCYKAEVAMGTGVNDKLTVYLTNKLRPVALSQVEKTLGNIEGFPLGFEIEIEGVLVKIMAVDILKKSLDKETFDIPNSYAKKTMDEFKEEIEQKMGTGKGGGIGL